MALITPRDTDMAEIMASLCSTRAYGYYRNHPGFNSDDALLIEQDRVVQALHGPHVGAALGSGPDTLGACLVHRLEWDSAHFGRPMGRLLVAHDMQCDAGQLVTLVAKATDRARSELGIEHISVDVDADDYTSLNAAIGAGYQVMDLKRTYATNRLPARLDFVRQTERVRPYTASDRASVERLLEEVRFSSRFTRDRSLDARHSAELYRIWFRNLLDEAGRATNVLVYEAGGSVRACGAIGERDFAPLGISQCIRQGSLYAGGADSLGAYVPIMYRLTREALDSHGVVETTVSLNLPVTARVVEGFRPRGSVTRLACRYVP